MAASTELLSWITQTKVVADTVAYSAAIGAWERTVHWQRALNLLSSMKTKEATDTLAHSAAISAGERGGK